MKTLGTALVALAGLAGLAAAQLSAPVPPPVPVPEAREPNVPRSAPPLRVRITKSGATVVEGPPREWTISDLRVPTQFGARYNTPYSSTGTMPPSALRGGAACADCDSCAWCGPYGRVWGEVDFILWKGRGDNVPVLVTASPAGTPSALAGILGTPGASVLAGGSGFSDDLRSGLRYNVGVWLNEAQSFGVQTGAFLLEDGSKRSTISSAGDPILARPFTNAVTGAPTSQLVALPATLAGSVAVDHRNYVSGFDGALRGNMCCASCWRLDALLGYRYLRIEDGLEIGANLVAGAGAPLALGVPTGANILVLDRFRTTNTFNGVQVGTAGEYRFRTGFFLSGTAKASLGWIDQVADIAGVTTVLVPGQAAVTNTGGLLALSSNIGQYAQSSAVIIPELNMNLGYQVTQNLRVRAGYSFLYVSSVLRPGTIIDTSVNPGLIPPPLGAPTPARPSFQDEHVDFILHGLNAGFELRF